MAENASGASITIDAKWVAIFLAGLLLGLIIGIGMTLVSFGRADSPPAAVTTPAPQPARWFISDASGPVVGQSFASDAECEQGRLKYLKGVSDQVRAQGQLYAGLTIIQLQALGVGDPVERLRHQIDDAQRAYCRQSG
jgi:hypothetical protein